VSGTPFADLDFLGVPFANPIVTASGTFNFGREYAHLYDLSRLGGITTKGTSPHPIAGNRAPRVAETPFGMLNAIGLENKGVERYVAEELPWLRENYSTRIIVNVFGDTPEEFAEVAGKLGNLPHLLEINLSCPNVHGGLVPFSSDPAATAEVVRRVKDATSLPLIVKLSPNTDPLRTAEAAEAAGADGFSLINTLIGMRIGLDTRKPVLANGTGGLSGPAVLPVAVRMVHALHRATSKPIIGMGGVSTWQDAVELALAGARLVAVGTATFTDPHAPIRVIEGVEAYLSERGERWVDLVGAAHL
jgi:dihydroorotate dehydrogenase (NAD+) catalytic subunit